jgi:SNF2 family DNA or RNA helicase
MPITMILVGPPPRLMLNRTPEVSDLAWEEIVSMLTERFPRPAQPVLVTPARLLRHRRVLQGVLRRNGVGLEPDARVRELLQRTSDDEDLLRSVLSEGVESSTVPLSGADLGDGVHIVRELRPFQTRDLARLLCLPHGANFSVPGAGKTTVTYALHAIERARGRVDSMLVVAPISAFEAWEEEANEVLAPPPTVIRWRRGDMPEADVIIVNYQRLPRVLDEVSDWMADKRVHLVVDEAHRAKRGVAGEWGNALLELAPLAARRDILTGTPAPNHPRDLVALMDILWPSGSASDRIPASARRPDPSVSAMAQVHKVIGPLFVRTSKTELQLPEIIFNPVRVQMGPIQHDIYSAMRSRYAGLFDLSSADRDTFSRMGEVLMYLLQAACSPRLLSRHLPRAYQYPGLAIPPNTPLGQLIDSYSQHEVAPKIARACAIISENAANGRKTLVWSNFPANLLDLECQLPKLQPAIVYGDIPFGISPNPEVRTRERELARFRNLDNECMVLLANPAAMSEGVSLHHACHEAIYLDRTYNAGQYLQSLDRIHRLGLAPGTITRVTLLLSAETIDEGVDKSVFLKTQRLAGMLSDNNLVRLALPDEEDYGTPLEAPDDLRQILAHLGEGR